MTFQERYQYNSKADLLGKGGFARVYKAKDVLLDREVAIKVFNTSDKEHYTVLEEIKKAIKLQHPNLLRYYDVAVVENTNALGETDTLEIGVMELANAGDLKQFAKRNPGSPVLFQLLQQVLSGLEYLHSKGIIHRDLKPQNILLVEEDGELTAKISDFGISKDMGSGTNSSSMAIGTIEYMAPEQFSPAKYGINGKIGTNVDLWSFGIMVHELLTNEPLFGQRSGNTTAEQIMNAILSQQIPSDVDNLPEPYRSVVRKCLVTDARQRIQKARDLIRMLEPSENQADSAETMVLDKSMIQKARQEAPPQKAPKQTAAPQKEKPAAAPVKTQASPEQKASKKPVLVYIIIAIVVLGGAGAGGYWWWMNKGAAGGGNGSAEALQEYSMAMQHPDDESGFIAHMGKAATLGYDSAQYRLANFYMNHNRAEDAAPLLDKLVDTSAGKVTSKYPGVLVMYAQVLQDEKDQPKKALAVLQSGADAGDDDCMFALGRAYSEGKITKKDPVQALKFFKDAADKNNAKAEAELGTMYLQGTGGVSADINTAVQYYFKSAEKGNSVALLVLGMLYASGKGVPQDVAKAKDYYQKVIDKGDNPDAIKRARSKLAGM